MPPVRRQIPVAGLRSDCFTARVYQLRMATLADLDFLADVVIEATREQGRMPQDFDERKFRVSHSQRTAEQIADIAGTSTTYVVEVGGRRAGRLRVVRTPDQIELAGIQLLPSEQSRGIGTRIISDLLTEATGARLPLTLSVEKDNPRAKGLYLRLGFVVTGETDAEFVMHLLRR